MPDTKHLIIIGGITIAANIAFVLGVNSGITSQSVCRQQVMLEIVASKQYQNKLDQMLRPDWVDELEKETQ